MKAFVIICLTTVLALVVGTSVQAAVSSEEAAWQKVVEAAKKEGVVNFSTTTFVGTAGVALSKAFKDKYGISLELITGKTSARTEKVKMEQISKNYITDAFDGLSPATLKRAGYLESVAEALPVLKEKNRFLRSPIEDPPEAQVLATLTSNSTFWYNTNLVKPGEEPKSYHDLLDPKWKGKIYLNNPLYGESPDGHMAAFVRARILTEDYFIKLYKNGTLAGVGGPKEIVEKLARGEFAIGGVMGADDPMAVFLAGAPIKPLDLKEGTWVRAMKLAAVKNPPHPNATKVFINWMLSKEGQLEVTKAVGVGGIRNDIPSVLPFSFKAPALYETYESMLFSEERYSKHYMANLLGIRR